MVFESITMRIIILKPKLIKFISTEDDNDLKDWDMDYIQQIEKTYDKVSRCIQYQKMSY